MEKYKNFGTALFFTAQCIENIPSVEELDRQFTFFDRYMPVSKVYLETHRDKIDMPREKLTAFRDYFENRGIKASGAITTTLMKKVKARHFFDETGGFASDAWTTDKDGIDENGFAMTWSTICYTDPENRKKLKAVSEFTASIFDEFILDDFFFTGCTCNKCIAAKGNMSWEDYRLKLMTEISEDVIVRPAKAVNPDVNVIIKYPNWYEAYQQTGYNPQTQPSIFGSIYTGVETRDPAHSKQHLPKYESYYIQRYLENIAPGHNLGAWMDWLDCIQNLDLYIEQAHLSLFAGAKELMLFCYSGVRDTVFVPPLGFELEKLDALIANAGRPVGIPVYEPHHGHGEDHLTDYLGMCGLPLEPTASFPETDSLILITENAAQDPDIIQKIKKHLMSGGDVCLTSGFIRIMRGRGAEELTSAEYTSAKATSDVYTVWEKACAFDGAFIHGEEVSVPFVNFMNNASDCVISLCKDDFNFPLLLKNGYGEGLVYTLTVPDSFADLYKYPPEVMSAIRRSLSGDIGVYIEGKPKVCIFAYDNDVFIIDSFLDFMCTVRVHVKGIGLKLSDMRTGEVIDPVITAGGESIFEIQTQTMLYRMFRIIR